MTTNTNTPKVSILVVDDRPENLIAMECVLERLDVEIVRATSGRQALSELLRHDFAVVLLDVQMPEIDGFEIASLMKKNRKTNSIPIIFVTAISTEQCYVFKGYESGAVDYLFKPLDPEILLGKVRVFLDLFTQRKELEHAYEELEEKTRHLERQKIQTQERNLELEATRDAVEKQARELARASQYKSEFLANMSHELRTPLNSMLILAGLLAKNEKGNLTEKQVEASQVIYNSGKDLLNLINDILDLSKVEAGRLNIEITNVPIKLLALRLQSQFVPVAKNRHLEFEVEIADDIPASLQTDAQRVEQIMRNLLGNAFKFTSKGVIGLRLHHPAPEARFRRVEFGQQAMIAISVTDTGIGIAEEQLNNIFDAFQQADGSTSRIFGGTGLGLTISRELTRLLGGELQVESQVGKGSVFTLYLPVEPATTTSSGGGEVAESMTAQPIPNGSSQMTTVSTQEKTEQQRTVKMLHDPDGMFEGKKVLLVDDDTRSTFALSSVLEDAGMKVLIADNGHLALEILEAEDGIDVVVIDIMMPIMDGYEVMKAIRAQQKYRKLPIIAVTAKVMPEDRIKSLESGANDYMTKPVDIDKLFSMMKVWLFREELMD